MSNLAEQIREALSMFARSGTEPALIGGLAVVAHQVVRAADGLGLLYAHRPLARRLLPQASERDTPMGRMRIISVEGLIGFKLQGFVNDATRTRDLDDASAVLAREAGVLFQPPLGDTSGIDPIAEWLSLMEVVQMLCPVWPVRDRPMQGNHWKI
jgi:hypothetical protein